MMFASLFLLFGREGWHLVNLAQEPVFLLSGTYFPDQELQLLGGRRRVADSVDAGAGRDPAADVPSGAELGFLDVRTEMAVLAVLSVWCFWSPRGCCCGTRAAGDC